MLQQDTREYLEQWIHQNRFQEEDYLFPSRKNKGQSISHPMHAVLIKKWCEYLSLNPEEYSTHSVRRSKAAYLYKKTNNVAAISKLLGHSTTAATVRYLGVDEDDALEMSEQYVL